MYYEQNCRITKRNGLKSSRSADYLLGRSNIRHLADNMDKDSLSEKELQMLSLFRTLSDEKKEQTIGLVFALKNF